MITTAENEESTITTATTTTTVFVIAKYIFILLMLTVLAFVIYTIVIKVNLLSFLKQSKKVTTITKVIPSVNGEVEKTLMDLLKNFKQ